MDDDSYKPPRWFKSTLGVSNASLRRWESKGFISALRSPGGMRLYSVRSVRAAFGIEAPQAQSKINIAYARVSSAKQKADLDRQVVSLKRLYPDHVVVTDVGSGLGFKRPGLRSILDQVHDGLVGQVAVLHKDRLCRFASGLLAYIFEKAGVKLVVHHEDDEADEFGDLAEDLLAVTTFFVASHNGRRSAQHRRERAKLARLDRFGGRADTVAASAKRRRASAEDPGPPDT